MSKNKKLANEIVGFSGIIISLYYFEWTNH
jgi:hypothetical protein